MVSVLIVKDESDVRETYVNLLESAGYTVAAVRFAQAALHLLVRESPDVIILDMQPPKVSGFLILSFIRRLKRLSRTKVIVAVGKTEMAGQDLRAWGADHYHYLTQPITLADLKHIIGRYTDVEPDEK